MPTETEDLTDVPVISEKEYRDFVLNKMGTMPTDHPANYLQRVIAEMNRRFFIAQGRQLEVQSRLLKAQNQVTESLSRATWVLAMFTLLLFLSTVVSTVFQACRH